MSIHDDPETRNDAGAAKRDTGGRSGTRRAFRAALSVSAILAIILSGINLWTSDPSEAKSRKFAKAAPPAGFNLTGLTIPRNEILSGGPGKDGIPALTKIKAIPVKDAPYQGDRRIVVITIDRKTRGYPLAILNWHEVANDVIGDIPIAVIYCPLCDSVSVVDRRIGGETLEFGISGLLHNSNVLLYDRNSNALWSQLGLQAISGPHVGKSLKHLPWQLTTFAHFARQFPKATVVSTNTGYRRDYTRNPYQAYFKTDRLKFPVIREDSRLKLKTAVVGLKLGNITRAYPVDTIRKAKDRKIVDMIGKSRIVLQADKDSVTVAEAPDKAMVVHTFWFAWAAFHPETSVYGQTPTIHQPPTTQPRAR